MSELARSMRAERDVPALLGRIVTTAVFDIPNAAVAMPTSRKQANLEVALTSRDLIGQAKGILMERYKISSQQAFEILVWASQHSHRKLREVSQTLAETGEL